MQGTQRASSKKADNVQRLPTVNLNILASIIMRCCIVCVSLLWADPSLLHRHVLGLVYERCSVGMRVRVSVCALVQVVCQEACRISAFPVAISALRTLHHHILSGDAVPGVVESDVLRCHVSCLEKQLPRQPHSRGDKAHEASEGKMGAGDSETVDVLGSLAQLMNQASKR